MSLAKAMLSRVFSRGSTDPLEVVDFDADHIGVYELIVCEDADRYTWRKNAVNNYEADPPSTNGAGHLRADAFDEAKEQIDDVDDHRGEVIATVAIDVDAWEYHVRMEVDR